MIINAIDFEHQMKFELTWKYPYLFMNIAELAAKYLSKSISVRLDKNFTT